MLLIYLLGLLGRPGRLVVNRCNNASSVPLYQANNEYKKVADVIISKHGVCSSTSTHYRLLGQL